MYALPMLTHYTRVVVFTVRPIIQTIMRPVHCNHESVNDEIICLTPNSSQAYRLGVGGETLRVL
jgi:hypothetical protein